MEDISLDKYKLWFETLMKRSEDAFIVVDRQGIIRYINDIYCKFLYVTKEEALGTPIEKIIPTTSMYDVMDQKLVQDQDVYIHPYVGSKDTITLSRRFCLFDDEGNVIGSMAQCRFREYARLTADRLFRFEDAQTEGNAEADDHSDKFDFVIGRDPRFFKLKAKALKVARKDFPIFLSGETGTGKEVFAQAIHMASDRRDGPMVSINCGAIPADLLESELFGYEEGAFTGARKGGKPGKFELANHGTLFLDEVADMPLDLQVKLLRVLQDFKVERLGSSKSIPLDVRVISATRKNVEQMVADGLFREDLYYRLNVVRLDIMPLRERKSDIPLFVNRFLRELNKKYSTNISLSPAVERAFRKYDWPGNIRELKNVVESAYASLDGLVIGVDDLPPKIAGGKTSYIPDKEDEPLSDAVASFETYYITDKLKKHDFRISETAAALGIDRSALCRKMKKYGITVKRELRA